MAIGDLIAGLGNYGLQRQARQDDYNEKLALYKSLTGASESQDAASAGLPPGAQMGEDGQPDYAGAAKSAKAYKAILTNVHGADPDQVETMSLGELRGRVAGMEMKSAMAEHAAKMQEYQSRMADYNAQAQQRAAAAQGTAQIMPFLATYAQLAGQPAQGPVNPAFVDEKGNYRNSYALNEAARQFPTVGQSPHFDKILALTGYGQESKPAGMVPGSIMPIDGVPGKGFVALSSGSGTVVDTGRPGMLDKPALPAEPGYAWRYNGKDWEMAPERAPAIAPAVAARIDALTAQEQAVLTEMATPYSAGWFGEKPEVRMARLQSGLENIRQRKEQYLHPQTATQPAGGKAETPAKTNRFKIVQEIK